MNNTNTMYTAIVPDETMPGDEQLLKDITDNVATYVNIITGSGTFAILDRGTVEGFDQQPWKEGTRFAVAEFRILTLAEIRELIANNGPAHEHLKENTSGYSH